MTQRSHPLTNLSMCQKVRPRSRIGYGGWLGPR